MWRSHAFAKCIICNSESIKLKEVQEEVSRGNDIVRVPVKVLVCDSCGERYYDRKTLKELEDLEAKILNKELPLKEIGKVLIYPSSLSN